MRFFLLSLFCALFSFAGSAQDPAPTPAVTEVEDVYLTKEDVNGKAGTKALSSFLPTDIPIYCVVQLSSTSPATVKMNLVAENVAGVKAETKVVSTSYTTKNGENRVYFHGRPAGTWVPGKYRADIFVNGALVKNLSFEIRGPVNVDGAQSFRPRRSNKPAPPPRKKNGVPFTAQVANP